MCSAECEFDFSIGTMCDSVARWLGHSTCDQQCPSLGDMASAVVIGDVACDLTLRLWPCNVGGSASVTIL